MKYFCKTSILFVYIKSHDLPQIHSTHPTSPVVTARNSQRLRMRIGNLVPRAFSLSWGWGGEPNLVPGAFSLTLTLFPPHPQLHPQRVKALGTRFAGNPPPAPPPSKGKGPGNEVGE